jgi:hypothetical protein
MDSYYREVDPLKEELELYERVVEKRSNATED